MIAMSPRDLRKFGAPINIEFADGELREAAFAFEKAIDNDPNIGGRLSIDRLSALLARRALFALADRIERDD